MAAPDSQAGESETCLECGNVALVPMPEAHAIEEPQAVVPDQADWPQSSRRSARQPTSLRQVQTIEKTDKSLKFHMLLAGVWIALSLLAVFASLRGTSGPLVLLSFVALALGLCWLIGAKVVAWWHHG